MRRVVWIVVAVLLLGGAGAFAWLRHSRRGTELHFETVKVAKGDIVARITATGTLSALVTVQVGSQVSGRLQQINVDFNSPVTKGQMIAKIDPALFDAAMEQARANFSAAEGNLAKAKVQAIDAKRQFTRTKSLKDRDLVAQADLDTADANASVADANVESAKGAVEQARASLHQAQVNLNYTSIVSPINGTVISRNVDVGQTVAASLSAPTLFTIAEDLRKMQVDTSVAEADVGKLNPGMTASFSVDAYPNERFKGTIRQIRNAPQTVQNVVTYDAVIDVENPELKLRPGMTANVTVVYAEKRDTLKVPNSALRFRPPPELLAGTGDRPTGGEGGGRAGAAGAGGGSKRPAGFDQRAVWVLRAVGAPERIPVQVGVSDGTTTEVVEGNLQAGDDVITDATGGAPKSAPNPGMMRRVM